jgi:hypothetical protein
MPSNPTPLSATQEAQVREIYYKNVRAKCGEEIAGQYFASNSTVSSAAQVFVSPGSVEKRDIGQRR